MLLIEITEKNLGIGKQEASSKIPYILRKAARAVVVDSQDQVALIFDPKHNHHKIPGGGVNNGETVRQALKREVKEEAGCAISLIDELGLVIEYRNRIEIIQISYVWLAKVRGKIGHPKFDKDERAEGHQLKWVSLQQAVRLFRNDKPRLYEGHFMWKRDSELIKIAAKTLNS